MMCLKSEATHVHQIHDIVPLEMVECVITFLSLKLLVNCEIVCVITPMVIDDCFFQGQSSLHPNDVSEAIHVYQIHDNVPLEMVECVIMFFSIQLLVNFELVPAITPIDGNG
jgi:hypothetical protein